MAEMEEVRTTRFTLKRFAACRTLSVPWSAGWRRSLWGSSRVHGDATWKMPEQPWMAGRWRRGRGGWLGRGGGVRWREGEEVGGVGGREDGVAWVV